MTTRDSSRIVFTACAALLALGLVPGSAHAVPEFPRAIQRALKLSYEPECGLCHAKGNTGVGTAITPFALSMRAHGLNAEDESSLTKALSALENDAIDSDGDGVIDVDELSEDRNPNSATTSSYSKAGDPQWGCSLAGAPRSATRSLLAATWLLGVALVARARRRR
ncbi:MAG TPA: hypothetical protein VHM19_02530 [Polyangiales bacterium]|jgi:hypothetical protein|nr:hypothetical protein [Polyangiales bacterium]